MRCDWVMKNFLKRFHSDKADSALIVFLLSIPLVLIVMGYVSDLNKNVNARTAFTTAAQESAQSAVRTLDSSGSLNINSVNAFVTQYRYHSNPSTMHTNEIGNYKSENCDTVEVNGRTYAAPYMVIKLDTERTASTKGESKVITVSGLSEPPSSFNFGSGNYKVITADVYDTSTNNWGVFGLPSCQTHHSSVSAVAFGSNEDL